MAFNVTLKPVTTRVRTVSGELYYEKREKDQFVAARKGLTDPNRALVGSMYYELYHVKQTEKWDCGLCCLSMVLSTLSKIGSDLESLKKGSFRNSCVDCEFGLFIEQF